MTNDAWSPSATDTTLTALYGEEVITFVDYVSEGETVWIYDSFDDAESDRGSRRRMVVNLDGDVWRLSPRDDAELDRRPVSSFCRYCDA